MKKEWLFKQLQKPKVYGSKVDQVQVLQTHISYVFLAGDFAFKVKKPVDFGFLDFSTLEKRRFYCEEELRLNQRLCPELYLEVIPITRHNQSVELNGAGEVVDYAVKMQRFPQERIMTNVLQHESIGSDVIEHICSTLVNFYNSYPSTPEITQYGGVEAVKQNINENFEQTQSKIDITIPQKTFEKIQNINNHFFTAKAGVFHKRQKGGFIHDCHGDLHSGNIVLTDSVQIFDCIEFNKRFRFCDVASDIGFLAMDLDFLNHPFLSSHLIHCYVQQSDDSDIFSVLNFYKCYRAYVRGKVAGFQLDDPHISKKNKDKAIDTAQAYFRLSQYYSRLMEIELLQKKPVLILVAGLTGTGKSTLARKLAIDYTAELVNTDVVRKEMAGIDKYEPHRDAFNTGLYDPKNIDHTYKQVIEKAQSILTQGHSVVIDATFVYNRHRTRAITLAQHLHIPLLVIQCTCKPTIVKQRLEKRMQKKSISDGRWEIYQQQLTTMDPFDTTDNYLEFDMGNNEYRYRMEQFTKIAQHIKKGCR
jgi:aminoglycoside phosphotransferase family enzyme/predicted kinase